MIADKQVRIYPGVDLERAVRILPEYLASENAQRVGRASATIFAYAEGDGILIYSRAKSIIVRPTRSAAE